ncbi:hypothetical protein HHI36_015369 [Cryptolaemus montrouzieri]|uniref:Uncharacterized protein n=1 Tax=Cryptolaemus montrouzieri TaxID=559131 RepID=A0ABD2N5D9_9CUCU
MTKKTIEANEDFHLALLTLRNTPDNLPILEKNLEPHVINEKFYHSKLNTNSEKSKKYYNSKGTIKVRKDFEPGTLVRFQEKPKSSWQLGQIESKIRDRTYKILKQEGRYIIRNSLYIRNTDETVDNNFEVKQDNKTDYVYEPDSENNDVSGSDNDEHESDVSSSDESDIPEVTNENIRLKRQAKVPIKI